MTESLVCAVYPDIAERAWCFNNPRLSAACGNFLKAPISEPAEFFFQSFKRRACGIFFKAPPHHRPLLNIACPPTHPTDRVTAGRNLRRFEENGNMNGLNTTPPPDPRPTATISAKLAKASVETVIGMRMFYFFSKSLA